MTVPASSNDIEATSEQKTQIDDNSIYILGLSYKNIPTTADENNNTPYQRGFISNIFSPQIIVDSPFQRDVESRPFFTYRTRFEPLQMAEGGPSPMMFQRFIRDNPINSLENIISNPDCFTTDIGWGCMIRTGQSLLANALQLLLLDRHFTLKGSETNKAAMQIRRMIIGWFYDETSAPFSIQNFVKAGAKLCNMKPGEWFGPAATATSIKELISNFPECGITDCVISISSGDIPQDNIQDIFADNADAKILILLGVKLGLSDVNPKYGDDILKLLESKYSVGIAGGRPSSSFYFFGHEGPELLYFDPHTPQNVLDSSTIDTCISKTYGRLPVSEMDPSMMVGILIQSPQDWTAFVEECSDIRIINIVNSSVDDISETIEEFDICSMESTCSNESFHPVTSLSDVTNKDDYVNIQPLRDEFKSGTIFVDSPNSSQTAKREGNLV